MKRAILIASAMLLSLASTAAFATQPPIVNWSDNFETHTIGNALHDYGYPWAAGDMDAYTVQDDAGNKVVQTSASPGLRYEWCETILGNQATAQVQWLHFKAKSTETATDTRFRDSVVATQGGGQIARFQMNASQIKAKNSAGNDSVPWNYNDGLWHDFDIIWDTTGTDTRFYMDGTLKHTIAGQETRVINNFEFWGNSWYGGPGWKIDDVAVGTVPEPSSLLALSAFGVGALGLIRRRRA